MEAKNNKTIIEIDKTIHGNLTISTLVIKKVIYNTLVAERYQLLLDDIEIVNYQNKKLEIQIKLMVSAKSNLINLKQTVIDLILKQVNAVLNINVANINLIFCSESQ